MKRRALAGLLLLCGFAWPALAQDCAVTFLATASGASAVLDNRNRGCSVWAVSYWAFGFDTVSVEFQTAPDTASGAGAWSTFDGIGLAGSNPLTSTTTGRYEAFGSPAWLRANVTTTGAGPGELRLTLLGWKLSSRGAATTASTGAFVTLGFDQRQIHIGQHFLCAASVSVSGSSSYFWLFRTAALGATAHLVVKFSVEGEAFWRLYEAPTISATGAALFTPNNNRQSATVSQALVFDSPTVTDPGVLLAEFFQEGGRPGSGGESRAESEWLLKKGEDYLVELERPIAGAITVGMEMLWDEQDVDK